MFQLQQCNVVLLLVKVASLEDPQGITDSFNQHLTKLKKAEPGVNLASFFSQSTMDLYGVLRSNLHTF